MASKFLIARDCGTSGGYKLTVHLDINEVDAAGNPDPEYVRCYCFGKEPPVGVSESNYLVAIEAEAKRLAVNDLVKLDPPPDIGGVQLGFEGAEF